MIRIAHISDSHFDERGHLADCIAVHLEFVQQAKDEGVDLILHSGDWFERRSTPVERNAVASWLAKASAVAQVVGLRGNHDVGLDLAIYPALQSVKVFERPTAITLGRFDIWVLPWFDKRHMAEQSSIADGAQAAIAVARDMLDNFRSGAALSRSRDRVPVLVAHLMVGGSTVSTGQMLIGQGVEFSPTELLDLGMSYVALGHIHKRQVWGEGRVTAIDTG